MEDRAHALVAVAFLVALSAGAGFVAWWMQAGRPEVNYYYVVSSHSVGGLQVQAPVKYKGIQVGTVRHIALDPEDPQKVRILVTLVENAPIKASTYAQLASQGVTGISYIALKGGGKGRALSTSKQNPAVIPMHPSTLQNVEESGTQILTQSRQITDQVSALLDKNNRQHVSAILSQLDSATRKLNTIEDSLLPAVKQLPPMIDSADKTLRQSQSLLKSMNEDARVVGRVGRSSGSAVRELRTQTLPSIERLTEHLDRTVEQVDKLTRQLSNQPRSLIFGRHGAQPGPGEPGFKSPSGGKR